MSQEGKISEINHRVGNIHLILGPMYAGKTTELIRLINRAKIAGKKCLTIKYYKDIRYDVEKLSTHDQLKINALISEGNSLMKTLSKVKNLTDYDCLFIDEIQFYEDAATVCDQLANEGYEVTVCGLQSNFMRKTFKVISDLLGFCDHLTHLTAIDSLTGNEASFTARLTSETQEELIGGQETYLAVDRSHYFAINPKTRII